MTSQHIAAEIGILPRVIRACLLACFKQCFSLFLKNTFRVTFTPKLRQKSSNRKMSGWNEYERTNVSLNTKVIKPSGVNFK